MLLQSPSISDSFDHEAKNIVSKIEPGCPRENPNVIQLFEGQYGPIRALSTHPTLNIFALGGDSGKIF